MFEKPRVRGIGAAGTPCRIPGWVSLCPGTCARLNVCVRVHVRVWNTVCSLSEPWDLGIICSPTHSFVHSFISQLILTTFYGTCLWPPGGNSLSSGSLLLGQRHTSSCWRGMRKTHSHSAQGFGFSRLGSEAWINIFKAAWVTDVQLIGENLVSDRGELPQDRYKLGLEWVI